MMAPIQHGRYSSLMVSSMGRDLHSSLDLKLHDGEEMQRQRQMRKPANPPSLQVIEKRIPIM